MKTLARTLISLMLANQIAWVPQAWAAPGADSAYVTDHAKEATYVHDATSEGINQVNNILCYVKAMAGPQLINQNAYVALIDESSCDSEGRSDAGKSGSENEGESAPKYNRAVVTSTRATNADPMVVKAWVGVSAGEDTPATVYARAVATEAPTDANPYGVFRMDYCGKVAGLPGCVFNGFIDASSTGIQYFERESFGGMSRDRALTLTRDSTTGQGALSDTPSVGAGKTFTFSYDDQFFRRSDGTSDQCFSRDRNDSGVRESVWRYGLYNADTGARITRNGGFPVRYSSGGTQYQGYVGYYGMHFQDGINVPNGATIEKQNFSSNAAGESYTLQKTGGKLIKFTKNSTTLDGIKNVRFNFGAFPGDVPGITGSQNKQLEAYWDGTQFVITGEFSCNANGCKTQNYDSAEVSNTTGWTTNYGGGMFGFSPSLGGDVFVKLNNAEPAGSTAVFYRTQALVYPDQMGSIGALHCIRDCPDATTLAAYSASLESGPPTSPFISATANRFSPTSATTSYTLNAATGELMRSGSAVVLDGQTGGQYRHGIRTGKLVPAGDVDSIRCGAGNAFFCEHKVNDLDSFYQWETGPNSWNQFTALKDGSGNFLAFDAPLQVNFAVPNDSAKYGDSAGSQIILQYNGFGNLFGIPGRCVSQETNQQVSCDSNKARYVAAFAIPYDQTVGRVTGPDSTAYLVGSLEREIRLAKKPLGTCTARAALTTLPGTSGLPTSSGLKNPADPGDATYIGEPPTVTDAPRVVHGEVKY
ncbi:MAG: putative periplasmic or secreted protein [Pseudomonadota bacterium]|jgi:hypothetical protein